MRSLFRTALAVVIALIAGIFVGRFSVLQPAADPQPTAAGSATAPTTRPATSVPTAVVQAPVLPTALPAGAPRTLRDTLAIRGDFAQTTALYALASSSDQAGIERLLEEAAALTQPSERGAATGILYGRYAEIDPAAALEHMLRRSDFNPGWIRTVFHNWARIDLDKALARANELDDMNRRMAASAILGARDDLPAEQRRELASRFDLQLPPAAGFPLDVRTPEAAQRSWEAALGSEAGEGRIIRLSQVANTWARQDPERAIEAIMALDDRMVRDRLLMGAVQTWAQKSPREAIDWVLARPPSSDRMQMLSSSLHALSRTDGAAAMQIVETLAPAERAYAQQTVVQGWAEREPRAALAWVERMEDGNQRRSLMTQVVNNYAYRKPEEAYRWAQGLSGPDAPRMLAVVVGSIANVDPVRAAGLVNSIPNETERLNAAQGVVYGWARKDPQATLNWIARLPESAQRTSMYSNVFSTWAQFDTEGAANQALQLSDARVRDAAIMSMVSNQYVDADTVDRLYQRLEGADARRQAAQQLYYRWMESDPKLAERYRTLGGVPPQQVQVRQGVIVDR